MAPQPNFRSQLPVFSGFEYEHRRPALLRRAIAHKAKRRLALGPDATLLFESRFLVHVQLHERMRAEGVLSHAARMRLIREHEALVPRPGEIRATVFVDGTCTHKGGLLARRFGDARSPVTLELDGRAVSGDVIAPSPGAVHYLRFRVGRIAPLTRAFARLAYEAGIYRIPLQAQTLCQLSSELGCCGRACGALKRG